MSKKAVAKKEETKKQEMVVGEHIDNHGKRLRPTTPIVVYTSMGLNGLECCPGFLSRLMPSGKWSVIYFQRHMVSWIPEAIYSETPKLHHWSFPESFDEWHLNRSEGQLRG